MAEVVGVTIEDGEGGLGPGEDVVGGIIGGLGDFAEKIFTGLFFAGDIAVAPWGPQVFHRLTMAMSKEQGKPQHLLIGGGDEPEVSRRAKELSLEWAPEDPLNLEKVDGRVETIDAALQSIAKTREGLETLPFLGGRKLVWLADCTFLGDNPAGRNEQVLEALASLQEVLAKIPPTEAQLLLSAPGVDKRRAFFRNFEKLGVVEVYDPPDLRKGRDRGEWMDEIADRLRGAGLQPGPGVVELLLEIVGSDGRALERELEKLRLYLKPETQVTEKAVREVGAGRRELEVWDWCDAVVAGRVGPARAGLRRLLDQGESEVGLVILLASSLRLAALGRTLQEARLLRVPPPGGYGQPSLDPAAESYLPRNTKGEKPNLWRLGKMTSLCAHRSSSGVRRAVERLHELQLELVSGADRGRVLEEGILRLCLD
jgi:DNA polymerase-3 subunit delta